MVTDDKIKPEMMSYYSERAEEYDQIFFGKGHINIDPDVYKKNVIKVSEIISRFGKGHLIDIAFGTGFWLPNYAGNCDQITFLDQSERMLSLCKERVEKLGLKNISNFIQGNLLDIDLETSKYDCALVGFILSHLTHEQEKTFWQRLKEILKTNPQLMFIDSVWNKRRKQYQEKEGIQERVLSDGRTFKVYKRYFKKSEVQEMLERYNFVIKSYYIGEAFIAAIACQGSIVPAQ